MPLPEFTKFYEKHLGLSPEDFKEFINSVQTPLHSALRITPSQFSQKIQERLSKYSFLSKIPFLKDVYTFNLKTERTEKYTEFIRFVVAQTDAGHIQRQEVVSLLPVMFLGAEGTHNILETCASPGSKTKNILENLTDGVLISNEKSSSRANILVSESMKRATPGFIITQTDAVHFPKLSLKFDRISCDVPCSGDGTCRKNPAIMPKWTVKNGIGLSATQLRILRRSLDLLKVGGLLVYSTCSLNPIEDEWIIDNAIGTDPQYELVDDFDFIQYENPEKLTVGEEGKPPTDKTKLTVRKGLTEFEYEKFKFKNEKLVKCFRVMPQDQNTGGFFVAVIRKLSEKKNGPLSVINILTPKFISIDEAVKEKLARSYDLSNCKYRLISPNSNFKNIFAVSDRCFEVLSNNPKLKVVYAGIKAFTHFDMDKKKFRARGPFLEISNTPVDFLLSVEDFKKLLVTRDVSSENLSIQPTGLFSCKVEGTSLVFCGFSGGSKVFLYIDDIHRRAYSQLYLEA